MQWLTTIAGRVIVAGDIGSIGLQEKTYLYWLWMIQVDEEFYKPYTIGATWTGFNHEDVHTERHKVDNNICQAHLAELGFSWKVKVLEQ
jgi:hypothetical protein